MILRAVVPTCLISGWIVLKEVIHSSINRIPAVNNAACVQYENVKVVCPLLGRKQTILFTVFTKKRPHASKSCKTNLFSPQLLGLVLFTGESIARKSPCSWLTPLCRKVESEKRICCRKGNPRGIKLSRHVSKWTMKLENNTCSAVFPVSALGDTVYLKNPARFLKHQRGLLSDVSLP